MEERTSDVTPPRWVTIRGDERLEHRDEDALKLALAGQKCHPQIGEAIAFVRPTDEGRQ